MKEEETMEKTIIVMPVANEETTMEQVLEEILRLPYESLYLYVVMDDYSRDRTADIVKAYEKGQKVKYAISTIRNLMGLSVAIWKDSDRRW